MEAPQALRLAILLGVLAFCAAWWTQTNYFDVVLVGHLNNGPRGTRMVNHLEFTLLPSPRHDPRGLPDAEDNPLAPKEF